MFFFLTIVVVLSFCCNISFETLHMNEIEDNRQGIFYRHHSWIHSEDDKYEDFGDTDRRKSKCQDRKKW